jgi:hypothetical protein
LILSGLSATAAEVPDSEKIAKTFSSEKLEAAKSAWENLMTVDSYVGYKFECWDDDVYPKDSPEPSLVFPYYIQFFEQYEPTEDGNVYFSSDEYILKNIVK